MGLCKKSDPVDFCRFYGIHYIFKAEIIVSKNKKLFKGSIGGFKKSQVVEYIEELNRKAKMSKEESDYEITRLESELSELSGQLEEFDEMKEELSLLRQKCEDLENENKMLSDDVSNSKNMIISLNGEKDALSEKLSCVMTECDDLKYKAQKYESDKLLAGDICDRAKAEASKILADARGKASDILAKARVDADKTLADSEKELAENLQKVRYLYKRREELLSAFCKVKDAAGGFYENIASALSDNEE